MSENLQAENERLRAELARVNKLRAELTRTVDQLADEIFRLQAQLDRGGKAPRKKKPDEPEFASDGVRRYPEGKRTTRGKIYKALPPSQRSSKWNETGNDQSFADSQLYSD
jgi:uncharacterized small protein (DUF1192 family)